MFNTSRGTRAVQQTVYFDAERLPRRIGFRSRRRLRVKILLGLAVRVYLNEGEYSGDDLILGRYLERPDGLTNDQYRKLQRKSRNFMRDDYLFKRGRKRGQLPRRVIGLMDQRLEIIRELHDECGHSGGGTTVKNVSRRYQ
jgi:hypothetical protein